jgi:hypothetical protein
MRRWLFPVCTLLLVAASALLVWTWATDAVLIHKCRNAGGSWDAEARSCLLRLNQVPASPASPPA